jgi:hypothetical protein
MGLISPTQVNTNDAIVKGLWNDPINTIANEFNGNIDNANIKSGAAIATAKLASDAGITAGMIGTGAIKLGYAEITANVIPGTNAETDVAGLSVAVTVPAGGRDLKITCKINCYNQNAGDHFTVRIKESSTVLETSEFNTPAINIVGTNQFSARVSAPASGAHTYKVSLASNAVGTAVGAGSTQKAFILVEAI